MDCERDDLRYDCALAAGLLIAEMVRARPRATTPQLVSFITYTCLEAMNEAERRRRAASAPSGRSTEVAEP